MKVYYVYIMASKRNGTLYIGVTSDLRNRILQHKSNAVKGFTEKYHVHTLVYFEYTTDINVALEREKKLKNWRRKWKTDLIEKDNPLWLDLSDQLFDTGS